MHDRAQIVGIAERDDAGDRNIKAEIERRFGEGASAAETMQHAGYGAFLAQDPRDIVIGVAGMDDQRQAALPRRRDMGAEDLLLDAVRAVVVVKIEPGFANADDTRMGRQRR